MDHTYSCSFASSSTSHGYLGNQEQVGGHFSKLSLLQSSIHRTRQSLSITNRGFLSLEAISSKKAHVKTKDLDEDDNLLTEENLKYKPMGFGQGKTYDTFLEDELLEKMEYKKAAESKMKIDAAFKKPTSKSEPLIIDGIKVWVGDLPKKKNVDRDLRSVFRHVPGLLNISPSVHGNEKTRDPICKGFGFLTFDTLEHARSFISSFEDQLISFGKVEKRISFSITKESTAKVVPSSSKSLFEVQKLRVRDKGAGKAAGSFTRPELGFARIVEGGIAVDCVEEREISQFLEPEVEVVEEEVEAASREGDDGFSEDEDDESLDEEESDNDFDSDDMSDFEVSVEIGDPPSAFFNRQQGVEGEKSSNAERHICELEERLRKKLGVGDLESQKKSEKPTTKPRGFNSRKAKALPKGNNPAAVTNRLKKKERELMTGVLEKYGRGSSSTKP